MTNAELTGALAFLDALDERWESDELEKPFAGEDHAKTRQPDLPTAVALHTETFDRSDDRADAYLARTVVERQLDGRKSTAVKQLRCRRALERLRRRYPAEPSAQ
jgi:hypothetical protein